MNLRPFGPEIRTNVRSCHLQTGKGRLFPRYFVSDGQRVTDSVAGQLHTIWGCSRVFLQEIAQENAPKVGNELCTLILNISMD